VCEVVSAREDGLDRLSTFDNSAQTVTVMLDRLEQNVKGNVVTSDEVMRWQDDCQKMTKAMADCVRFVCMGKM